MSVALRSSAAPSSTAPQPTRPKEPLNVVLLTIDSMRQDMPWAGYGRSIAPNLTKLAEQSVVYTHAYSVSSYTAKSVGALLTGRYPSTLYRSGWFFTGYSDANLFFTEVLQQHGIRTISGQAHLYFGRGKNLNQGFDVWELVPGITFDPQTDKGITSDKMTDLAIRVLGDPANTAKPFFAWFHYMDPHDEYNKHSEAPDWGKTNRDRYDSEIFFADLHIGRLLEWAKQQPWWKQTILIVSADHGEAFGEHGAYKHAFWLWDVLTRVPLFVHGPGLEAKRIDVRRSHVDIAPTVLDLMGVHDIPKAFVGHSLVPELYGLEPPALREPIVLDLPEDSHNPQIRAVISGDYKLIVYGPGVQTELYDLTKDPGEETNLVKTQPEKYAEMKALFDKTWAGIPFVASFGGVTLKSGAVANGPTGPVTPASDKEP